MASVVAMEVVLGGFLSLLEIDTIVSVTVLIRECAAAQSNCEKEGESPSIEVLHDGLLWVREGHCMDIRHEIEQGYVLCPQLAGGLTFPFDISGKRVFHWGHGLVMGMVLYLVTVVGTGCRTPATLGSDAARPYQWENLPHHPAYAWHRPSADSAVAYVQLPAHEPLHLRENRNEPFRFSMEFELLVQTIQTVGPDSLSENGRVVRHKFLWEGQAEEGRKELTARFVFPLEEGRYRIMHILKDRHRGSEVSGAVMFDGWSADAPVRCLAFCPSDGTPSWGGQTHADEWTCLLIPPDLANTNWSHNWIPPVDSFPSAPFLDRTPNPILFPQEARSQAPVDVATLDVMLPPGDWRGWRILHWPNEPGIHRWTLTGSARHVLLSARRPHFPEMRDLDEMIRATRYIATRDEYRAMRESRNPKEALDAFWLQFSSNSEEARGLIQTYYGRIREANVHFSGLREGWCTDRGMVHVVFGHPDRIRRDRYGETWVYGEEGDVNALIFRFSSRAIGDDFNVFQLERYPGFRSPWEAMVSSWRRGKIRRR